MTLTLEERKPLFWKKVDKGPRHKGCWVWTAYRNPKGYGMFNVGNQPKLAHRLAYEWTVGPITAESLDHLCMNQACVNPDHLEPVSKAENTRRWAETVTHCPQGHEYLPETTRMRGNKRSCKTCENITRKERYKADSEYREAKKLASRAYRHRTAKHEARSQGGCS